MPQVLGFVLLGLAVIGLVFGLLQHLKAKKIIAAPFKKTGEVASNPSVADAKGLISCEGRVAVDQPFLAPASGKPCIYYEIKVERMWEKTEATEDGMKTRKGTSSVATQEQGTRFSMDDGSGPVAIDAREKVDTNDLVKSFEQAQNVSWGDVRFGQYQVHVPSTSGEERTTGVRCIEKILPAEGGMFAMGKLAGGAITKQDGMLGKLLLSSKGRDKLIGSVKTKAIVGFVLGGLMFAPGVYGSVFGDASSSKDSCAGLENEMKEVCSARFTERTGKSFDWKVSKPGGYRFVIQATGKDKILRLWPVLTVKKGTDDIGTSIGAGDNPTDGNADVEGCFDKGDYKLVIKDVDAAHVEKLKGGAGFTLNIKALPDKKCAGMEKASDGKDESASKGDEPSKKAEAVKLATAWKVGDEVDVQWNGAWWQAKVVGMENDSYKVHYVGYASSWDEAVPATRVRNRTKSSQKGSGKD